jgi:hypothetical protein
MSLILKSPWTRQPQFVTGIDWQNSLAKGLAFATVGSTFVDQVSGAAAVLSGASNKYAGPVGMAYRSPTTQIAGRWTFAVAIPAAFNITALVVTRGFNTGTPNSGVPTINFVATDTALFAQSGNGTIFQSAGNSTANSSLVLGSTNVVVGVKLGATNYQYVNGILKNSAATGNRTVGAVNAVNIGRPSGNNVEQQEYYAAFYFTRALSAKEIALLSANPWQLFAPLPRRIWAPAGGGGGTTYNQAISGVITTSGIVGYTITFSKGISGILTPSGVTSKQTTKAFASGITAAGVIVKQTNKRAEGSITGEGVGSGSTGAIQALQGSITASGAIFMAVSYLRSYAASLTLAGALNKLTMRSLSGSIVAAGQAVKQMYVRVTGSLTTSGTLSSLKFTPTISSVVSTTLRSIRRFIGRR